MNATSSNQPILQWAPLVKEDTLYILIIHDLEKEKMMLADTLANRIGMKCEIHVVKALPLPRTKYKSYRYNYLVFMLDLTRRHSFIIFEEAIKLVDINFFLGRCCFVAFNMLKQEDRCCRSDIIGEIKHKYKTPVFHGNFSNEEELNPTAFRIKQHIKEAFGI